jgi:exosortase/archaeosortase family protein
MKYRTKLIFRLAIAITILLIPYDYINFAFTKITLYPSYLLALLKYSNVVLENNYMIINNTLLRFIPACIGASAYCFLLVIILLTKDIKLKTRINLFLLGSLLILILNMIRIEVLIYILMKYGSDLFRTARESFWMFISGVYVAIVWLFLTWKFKIKTIPVYSDLRYLCKKLKKTKLYAHSEY